MNRRAMLGLTGLGGLLAAAACSTSGQTGGGAASTPTGVPSGAVVVKVENFSFEPQSVTVPRGGTVVWQFVDSATHNAVADDKSFASANLHSGALFSHVFDQPGTVAYRCTLHQYMTGSVTVIGTA